MKAFNKLNIESEYAQRLLDRMGQLFPEKEHHQREILEQLIMRKTFSEVRKAAYLSAIMVLGAGIADLVDPTSLTPELERQYSLSWCEHFDLKQDSESVQYFNGKWAEENAADIAQAIDENENKTESRRKFIF